MNNSTIPLEHIDLNDLRFCLLPIPPTQASAQLRDSISRVGILHPPLLLRQSAEQLVVVSGRQRLLAAASLHQNSCFCRVLAENTPPVEVFALLLEESLFTSAFTIAEQAIFLQKVGRWLNKEESAHRFLAAMGISPHGSQVERLLRLADLEEIILASLHQGELDSKVAYELQRLNFHNRMALFEIITTLRLSVSNQKKLLIICRELAVRQGVEIAEFIAADDIQAILNQPGNLPQISHQLFNHLNELRFPRATTAEEEFTDYVRRLPLPPASTVSHSPYFEKDEVTLNLTFANRQGLTAFCRQHFRNPRKNS